MSVLNGARADGGTLLHSARPAGGDTGAAGVGESLLMVKPLRNQMLISLGQIAPYDGLGFAMYYRTERTYKPST